MFLSNLIPIEDVLVRPELLKVDFACDLSKCKGACCTLDSEFGAPVTEEEIDEINSVLYLVKDYLQVEHKTEIEQADFFETRQKELLLRSHNNKACVFVFYENGTARCALEKAFIDGKTNFRKPISCHLFPIRVSEFGGDVIRYEKITECEPAVEKGKAESVSLVNFCKEPLERKYGINWYNKLKEISGK